MDLTEIQEKKQECIKFLDTVLQPELNYAMSREKGVKEEIDEYDVLRKKLQEIVSSNKKLEPLVDLGFGKVHSRAKIEDTKYVFVQVGMGFHVELSLLEAVDFCEKRITFLRETVLRHWSIETEKVRQHIQASQIILDGLSAELEMISR